MTPSKPNTYRSLQGTIFCRRKPDDSLLEFKEDYQHHYTERNRSSFVHDKRIKKVHAQCYQRRRKDIFCNISAEGLGQGVFSVRDVVVLEGKALVEFTVNQDMNRNSAPAEAAAAKRSDQLVSINNQKEVTTIQSALADWSSFLESIIVPSLCHAEFPGKNERSFLFHSNHPEDVVTGKENGKYDITRSSFETSVKASNIESATSHRHEIRESHSPTSVVYPIAKYRSHLNNNKLVEQRRQSLREHLTFRPVSE